MIVLGLTGSIGMGKTTAAAALRRLKIPVFEADACVHRLLAKDGAAAKQIAAVFPGTVEGARVDRAKLGAVVFMDTQARRKLEAIIHPLVRAEEMKFLKWAQARRARFAVLDLPLLFETGAQAFCDATAVVTAPAFVQEGRVLSRPGMTRAKFAAILASQMADADKRRRADFTVPTGLGQRATLNELRRIVRLVRQETRRAGATLRAAAITEHHARNRPRYRNHRP